MAHYNIGIILVSEKKYDEAAVHFRGETDVNPDYLPAYNSLGNSLYLAGDKEGAVASYTKALTIDPAFYKAHMNLGVILKEIGRIEDGEAHMQEAERLRRKEESLIK